MNAKKSLKRNLKLLRKQNSDFDPTLIPALDEMFSAWLQSEFADNIPGYVRLRMYENYQEIHQTISVLVSK